MDLESRLSTEKLAREEADAKLRSLAEAWTEFDRYLHVSEVRAADARASFGQQLLLRDGSAKLVLSPAPMYQPPQPRRPHPPPSRSQFPGFPLPPPAASHSVPSRIRQRTDSNDDPHPPAKRLRADRSGRYPHETARVPYGNSEVNHLHLTYPNPNAPPHAHHHAHSQRGRRPSRSPSLSPTRSRSRSSSMSLDEMLLQVATDEHPVSPASATPYYRPPGSPGMEYTRLPPVRAPGSPSLVQYQTHIFAPPVTGPPGKKGKGADKSSTIDSAPASARTGSLAGLPPGGFGPTNDKGQRICRQCGMPGRYKEGKCVEKWGPGPEGPGTVCDR
ncbi:hypothetical protein BV25DRAFT_1136864 [Artomyces pyxidatus]|uniref:Uncharacterized protein n=1 Tax=Artomyces pyxidatus TaxID=48021 RepID=A0ACB8STP7_9AGAM|nr:hypothetical protein BV25DRAFT_1136864 [Artomyces pyxidatus]